uniref:Uncharacterized protein n=1 Tax=Caenorhabditis tropicalis TaxID=1561998 RepID=A0A1I7T853_9PELO
MNPSFNPLNYGTTNFAEYSNSFAYEKSFNRKRFHNNQSQPEIVNDPMLKFKSSHLFNETRQQMNLNALYDKRSQGNWNADVSRYQEFETSLFAHARSQRSSVPSECGTSYSSDGFRYDSREWSPFQRDLSPNLPVGTTLTSTGLPSANNHKTQLRMSVRLAPKYARQLKVIAKYHPETLTRFGVSILKTSENDIINLDAPFSLGNEETMETRNESDQIAPEVQVPDSLMKSFRGFQQPRKEYSTTMENNNVMQLGKSMEPTSEFFDMPLREYLDLKHRKSTGVPDLEKKQLSQEEIETFLLPPIKRQTEMKTDPIMKQSSEVSDDAAMKISQVVNDVVDNMMAVPPDQFYQNYFKKFCKTRKPKTRQLAPLKASQTVSQVSVMSPPGQKTKIIHLQNEKGEVIRATLFPAKAHLPKISKSSLQRMPLGKFLQLTDSVTMGEAFIKPTTIKHSSIRSNLPSARGDQNQKTNKFWKKNRGEELTAQQINLLNDEVVQRQKDEQIEYKKKKLLQFEMQQEAAFMSQFTDNVM